MNLRYIFDTVYDIIRENVIDNAKNYIYDDFGQVYVSIDYVEELENAVKKYVEISDDYEISDVETICEKLLKKYDFESIVAELEREILEIYLDRLEYSRNPMRYHGLTYKDFLMY